MPHDLDLCSPLRNCVLDREGMSLARDTEPVPARKAHCHPKQRDKAQLTTQTSGLDMLEGSTQSNWHVDEFT
eukprot:1530258-Amphidinium_carterae.1